MLSELQRSSSEDARLVGKRLGEAPGFVSALPAGRTLAEVLEADSIIGTNPPLRGRLSMALEIIELIGHLHQNGIIHRDVKPENIVLGDAGGLYLRGLEQAKRLGSPEIANKALPPFIGTPGYAPPEQLRNPADIFEPRSDLFSFGAVLYELITGQRAFQAANELALILQTIERQPQAPSKLSSACTPELDALCASLFAKQKERRPASAQEVSRQLSLCIKELHSLSVKSPPLSGNDLPSEPSLSVGGTSLSPLFGDAVPAEPSMPPSGASSSEPLDATLPSKPSVTPSGKGAGLSTGQLKGFTAELGGSLPTVVCATIPLEMLCRISSTSCSEQL